MSWKWSNATFPATAWTLTYTLVSAAAQIQIVAANDGSDHLIEVTSTTSATYAAGDYTWQAHVSNGSGERSKVDEGVMTVTEDFATHSNGYDSRSHTKKVLDALNASIENRASKTQITQQINGVQIQHIALEDQIRLRDRYAMKYRKELAAKRGESCERTTTARFAN